MGVTETGAGAGAATPGTPDGPARRAPWWVRALFVAGALGAWFYTQSLIAAKGFPEGGIGDGVFQLTISWHDWLEHNPGAANALLIASSAILDLLGVFLLGRSIFGPSLRPLLGLLVIFGLRQICQFLCALPAPPGEIWRHPGFPSLLVTYGVSNDFFFSGHTALATYGAVELARLGGRWLAALAVLVAAFEALVVLVLRAHYTMDVIAGIFVALYVATLLDRLAPPCDRALDRLCGRGAVA